MIAVISDISGKEISKHVEPKAAQVFIGGVVYHLSEEEQVEVTQFIAKLQKERMPEEYTGEFEPNTDAQEAIDAREKQLKRRAEREAMAAAEEEDYDDEEFFDDED